MSEYVTVKTVSMFYHTYALHKDDLRALNTDANPSDEDLQEWAKDAITCDEAEDLIQEWIGEQILETGLATEDDLLEMFQHKEAPLKGRDKDFKLNFVRGLLSALDK